VYHTREIKKSWRAARGGRYITAAAALLVNFCGCPAAAARERER